jgi:hypothetical protein
MKPVANTDYLESVAFWSFNLAVWVVVLTVIGLTW